MIKAKKYSEAEDNSVGDRRVQRARRPLGDITNASSITQAGPSITKRAASSVPNFVSNPQENYVESTENVVLVIEDDRAYMQRDSDDIDSRDNENQLLCSQYVNQMYEFFKVKEREMMINASYIHQQTLINDKMRCILFDWLVISRYHLIYVNVVFRRLKFT
jgi:hypothetical protein